MNFIQMLSFFCLLSKPQGRTRQLYTMIGLVAQMGRIRNPFQGQFAPIRRTCLGAHTLRPVLFVRIINSTASYLEVTSSRLHILAKGNTVNTNIPQVFHSLIACYQPVYQSTKKKVKMDDNFPCITS